MQRLRPNPGRYRHVPDRLRSARRRVAVGPRWRPTAAGWCPGAALPAACALLFAALCLATAAPAFAQRAADNAVTAAEDAFGVSVGRESIGLYTADNVRGFSAIDAGNLRLDGLYYDQVWGPSPRLLQSTTMRVGIAAQGFLFPAPTGVVDYALRHPGGQASASGFVQADTYANRITEVDLSTPLDGGRLALGVGAGDNLEGYANGSSDRVHGAAVMLAARPVTGLEITGFWSHSLFWNATVTPYYLPGGAWLPPAVDRRRFVGLPWARNSGDGGNTGLVARFAPDALWKVELGVFDSQEHDPITFNSLYLDLTPSGQADHLMEVDADNRNRSRSGELRVSHAFTAGDVQQVLVATLRGRLRQRHYGGSAAVDLGAVVVNQPQDLPLPALMFGTKDADSIRQQTAGLAWRARQAGVGEISVDVQHSDYDKQVALAGQPSAATRSRPWLPGLAGTLELGSGLLAYASDTQGLEDSGSAPPGAANRNEPLAAVHTHQRDAGVRWKVTPRMALVAGVFDLHKPYYSFDAGNRFVQVGQVSNRGVELSLSGALSPSLDLVTGGVLAQPRVTGGSTAYPAGPAPVAIPRLRALANLEWRPPALAGLALDAGFNHLGSRPASADNRVFLPPRTTLDLGARFRLQLGPHPAQLRLAVTNVTDVYGVDTYGSGTYDVSPGRVVQFSLGVDG